MDTPFSVSFRVARALVNEKSSPDGRCRGKECVGDFYHTPADGRTRRVAFFSLLLLFARSSRYFWRARAFTIHDGDLSIGRIVFAVPVHGK